MQPRWISQANFATGLLHNHCFFIEEVSAVVLWILQLTCSPPFDVILSPAHSFFKWPGPFEKVVGLTLERFCASYSLQLTLVVLHLGTRYCLFHCMAWLQDKGFKSLSLLAKGKIISSLTALQKVQFTVHALPAWRENSRRDRTSNWLSVFPYCRSVVRLNVISVWQTLTSGAV